MLKCLIVTNNLVLVKALGALEQMKPAESQGVNRSPSVSTIELNVPLCQQGVPSFSPEQDKCVGMPAKRNNFQQFSIHSSPTFN